MLFLRFQVALLDYGQVKEMPDDLRLAYANLVVAMADDDFVRAEESFMYAQSLAMLYSTVYIYLNSWRQLLHSSKMNSVL